MRMSLTLAFILLTTYYHHPSSFHLHTLPLVLRFVQYHIASAYFYLCSRLYLLIPRTGIMCRTRSHDRITHCIGVATKLRSSSTSVTKSHPYEKNGRVRYLYVSYSDHFHLRFDQTISMTNININSACKDVTIDADPICG